MYSRLKPTVIYQDTSPDVTEHDIDVMSDLWEMDGRSVYRGARDPRYTHANVYWLYSEDLDRVGCCEHSLEDHADFRILWFHDSPFGTLFQEEGWTRGENIWAYLPQHVAEYFFDEGWTTPHTFLEHCLKGEFRILTPAMVVNLPMVYSCDKCGRKSLTKQTCMRQGQPLDLPNKKKLFFVDDDLFIYTPPSDSVVWSSLKRQHGDGSSDPKPQEQVEPSATPSEETPPHVSPPHTPSP